MKIPRRIKIKDKSWCIKMVKSLKDDDNNEVYGLCDFQKRTIQITKGLDKTLEAHTFLHEFFHACLYELHVDINREIEEVIVDGISAIMSETFHVQSK